MNSHILILLFVTVLIGIGTADPIVTDKELHKFHQDLMEFSAAMFYRIQRNTSNSENIFFSPASIAHTIGMVATGARGKTAQELKRVLRMNITESDDKLDALFRAVFLDKFTLQSAQVITLMASRAFIKDKYDIISNYTDSLKKNYFAEIEALDFAQSDLAAQRINMWVEQQTFELIKDLVSPSMFSALTRFTLVNALYFKAPWARRFTISDSKVFMTPSGNISLPFMKAKAFFKFKETENATYVGIPYKDGETYMVIIMPKNNEVMQKFQKRSWLLSYFRNLDMKIENWQFKILNLWMPGFKVEKALDVKKTLRRMYVRKVFSSAYADLSGISDEFLYVSDFVHKATITVDEKGTEAAAASAAVGTARSLVFPDDVYIDRPFIFAIYQRGTILFMGRLVNPTEQ